MYEDETLMEFMYLVLTRVLRRITTADSAGSLLWRLSIAD